MFETIHILSHNRLEVLKESVEAIEKHCDFPYTLIIVDDASTDKNVIDYLASIKKYKVYINKENLGWAGAFNTAVSASYKDYYTDYIIHLDNDIIVKYDDWNKMLVLCMEKHKEIGLLSVNYPGYNIRIDRGEWEESDWVIGGCFIIRKEALESIRLYSSTLYEYHLIDERLAYQVESDLCLRLRMAGWKVGYIKDMNVDIRKSLNFQDDNKDNFQLKLNIGTMQFSQKWNRYFGGKNFNYYDDTNLRWIDYPINRTFYREFFKSKGIKLNENPDIIKVDGWEYDVIKELKDKDKYRDIKNCNIIKETEHHMEVYKKYKDKLVDEWK